MITLQKQPIFLLTGGVVSQASDSSLSKNSMVKQKHRIHKLDKLYQSPCQGRDVWTTSDWTTSKGDWYCCLSGVGQVDGKRRSQLSDAVTVFFIQTLRWYFHRDAVTVFFIETLRWYFHRDVKMIFPQRRCDGIFHIDVKMAFPQRHCDGIFQRDVKIAFPQRCCDGIFQRDIKMVFPQRHLDKEHVNVQLWQSVNHRGSMVSTKRKISFRFSE